MTAPAPPNQPPILSATSLSAGYGRIPVLRQVSLEVHTQEIVTLIGSNGAGKTTTLAALSRMIPLQNGTIYFLGQDLGKLPSHAVARLGLIHVPEGRRLFQDMTVEENLLMGAAMRSDKSGIRQDLEKCYDTFRRLYERRHTLAGALSGGEQQMGAIARGLMARPRLLMLDEPSLGLSPKLVDQIFSIIQEIHQTGTPVLLVEQNAHMALAIAHRAYAMSTGEIILTGTGKALLHDPEIRKLYLGED
jgi:branched-chain amino acid transport system ATP-binding protein